VTNGSLLRAVANYVGALLRPKQVEGEVKLDPHTGLPTGFGGKIVLREPDGEQKAHGLVSVPALFEAASRALAAKGLRADGAQGGAARGLEGAS
jgi:hypothetical protein